MQQQIVDITLLTITFVNKATNGSKNEKQARNTEVKQIDLIV